MAWTLADSLLDALGEALGSCPIRLYLGDASGDPVQPCYGPDGTLIRDRWVELTDEGALEIPGLLANRAEPAISPGGAYYWLEAGDVRIGPLAGDDDDERTLLEALLDSPADLTPAALVAVQASIAAAEAAAAEAEETATAAAEAAATAEAAAALAVKATPLGELEVPNAGDVFLAAGAIAAGELAGGAIRRANAINLAPPAYVQLVDPEDSELGRMIGRWVNIDWNATLAGASTPHGPIAAQGPFGPAGAYTLQGRLRYSIGQTSLGLMPISFADLFLTGNTEDGVVSLTDAWGFMFARWLWADGGAITLNHNDTLPGGAGFVDNHLIGTRGGGEIDGLTNDVGWHSYASVPYILGNTDLRFRFAFHASDFNAPLNTWEEADDGSNEEGDGELLDLYNASVEYNVGLHVHRMTRGIRNLGIWNKSATAERPWTAELEAAGDQIEALDQTLTALDNASGGTLTLTSTPTIPAGVDGQRIVLLNISADPVIVQDQGSLAGSLLALGAASRTIGEGGTITLRWSADLGAWVEEACSPSVALADSASAAGAIPAVTAGQLAVSDASPTFGNDGTYDRLFLRVPSIDFAVGGAARIGLAYNFVLGLQLRGSVDGVDFGTLQTLAVGAPTNPNHTARYIDIYARPTVAVASSRAIANTDPGKILLVSAAATLSLANISEAQWPIGASCVIVRTGAGAVSIAAAGGQTLLLPAGQAASLKARGRIRLLRVAASSWLATGDLEATGDIEITDPDDGLILTSPDLTRWRIRVGNDGALSTEEV